MFTASLRTAVVTAALLLASPRLHAQAAHAATAPSKPAAPAPAKPAAPPAPAARAAAPSAAAKPTTTVPAAAPAAPAAPAAAAARTAPARDAKGRFVSKKAAGVTATCTDGSTWTGKTRSGACARHGGVKQWN
jgi:hypothetical protein